MRYVIWLKHIHNQTDDITGILELDGAWGISDDDNIGNEEATSEDSATPSKPEGNIMWSDPVVTVSTASAVTQPGRIIKPPER